MSIWILVLGLSIPALLCCLVRIWWLNRRGYTRKAGILLGVSLAMVSVFALRRHDALQAMHQEDPQSFRFSSNPLVRSLFTPAAAPISVTDDATGQDVFTYYRNDGAARLISLERPAPREWLVKFSVSAGESHNPKLQDYFEKEVKTALPLSRVYRSFTGGLRVEDIQTGVTLFRYWEESPVVPVEAQRITVGAGAYEWKVRFALALPLSVRR